MAELRVLYDTGSGVVTVVGELDATTAHRLHRVLEQYPTVRIVDMNGVTFIDVRGLDPLLAAVSRRHPTDDLVVRAPSRKVLRLLELTGLVHRVTITD